MLAFPVTRLPEKPERRKKWIWKKAGTLQTPTSRALPEWYRFHDPRFVIYVVLDDPKKQYYGSEVAAPIFARVGQFALRKAGVAPVLLSEKNVFSGQSDSVPPRESRANSSRSCGQKRFANGR